MIDSSFLKRPTRSTLLITALLGPTTSGWAADPTFSTETTAQAAQQDGASAGSLSSEQAPSVVATRGQQKSVKRNWLLAKFQYGLDQLQVNLLDAFGQDLFNELAGRAKSREPLSPAEHVLVHIWRLTPPEPVSEGGSVGPIPNAQEVYQAFLHKLRDATKVPQYRETRWQVKDVPRDTLIVQVVAMHYFLATNMEPFADLIFEEVLGAPLEVVPMDDSGLDDAARNGNRLRRISGELMRLNSLSEAVGRGKGRLNLGLTTWAMDKVNSSYVGAKLDPPMRGNLPYLRKTFYREDGAPIHNMRMPTATIRSKNVEIAPEFLAYLDFLKRENATHPDNKPLTHTYLNFQDRFAPSSWGFYKLRRLGQKVGIENESHRVAALEERGEGIYKDVLQVITLAKNSDFYGQKRKGDDKGIATQSFITEFLRELFAEDGQSFHLPSSWRTFESGRYGDVQEILNFVHKTFFDGREILGQQERRDFIELVYVFLGTEAARESYSMNLTCKSGIDRAGGANALLELLLIVVETPYMSAHEFSEHEQTIPRRLIQDALVSRFRGIKSTRLERFSAVGQRVLHVIDAKPEARAEIARRLGMRLTPKPRVVAERAAATVSSS